MLTSLFITFLILTLCYIGAAATVGFGNDPILHAIIERRNQGKAVASPVHKPIRIRTEKEIYAELEHEAMNNVRREKGLPPLPLPDELAWVYSENENIRLYGPPKEKMLLPTGNVIERNPPNSNKLAKPKPTYTLQTVGMALRDLNTNFVRGKIKEDEWRRERKRLTAIQDDLRKKYAKKVGVKSSAEVNGNFNSVMDLMLTPPPTKKNPYTGLDNNTLVTLALEQRKLYDDKVITLDNMEKNMRLIRDAIGEGNKEVSKTRRATFEEVEATLKPAKKKTQAEKDREYRVDKVRQALRGADQRWKVAVSGGPDGRNRVVDVRLKVNGEEKCFSLIDEDYAVIMQCVADPQSPEERILNRQYRDLPLDHPLKEAVMRYDGLTSRDIQNMKDASDAGARVKKIKEKSKELQSLTNKAVARPTPKKNYKQSLIDRQIEQIRESEKQRQEMDRLRKESEAELRELRKRANDMYRSLY